MQRPSGGEGMLRLRISDCGIYLPGVSKKIQEETLKLGQSKKKNAAMLLSDLTAEVALEKSKAGLSGQVVVYKSEVQQKLGSTQEAIDTIAAFLWDYDRASFQETLGQWGASMGYSVTCEDTPTPTRRVNGRWQDAIWQVTMTPRSSA